MSLLTRRGGLSFLASAAAFAAAPQLTAAAGLGVFQHGVASGDPAEDSVVLWTRVTTPQPEVEVVCEVATDPDFSEIVWSRRLVAAAERDHTVKAVPDGLKPGAVHHYRFHALGETSPAGRARTLPAGRLDSLGLAVASCANYALGAFTTYEAIAQDDAVDFVLHTGDYIYEYGDALMRQSNFYVRPCDPPGETLTLSDYRRRHAIYKRDPQLQRMHAAHVLIALWDDHEFANDTWVGGAENHQPDTEGPWQNRREAALQAYFEWMPVRPAPAGALAEAGRAYRFGDLATLVTLETRLTGRAQPIDYRRVKDALQSAEDRQAFVDGVLGDRNRTLLSERMASELAHALTTSVREQQPWRLIGNGTLMARTNTPDVRRAGLRPDDYPELQFLDQYTDLLWKADNGLPDDLGAWDGYAGARQGFYELCQRLEARDLLVLSGDSHRFWSNRLADDAGVPMGVELGTAGACFPSEFRMAQFRPELMTRLDALYTEANPEVRWNSSAACGYVRLSLGRDAAEAAFIAVDTTRAGPARPALLRRERILRQGGGLAFQDA